MVIFKINFLVVKVVIISRQLLVSSQVAPPTFWSAPSPMTYIHMYTKFSLQSIKLWYICPVDSVSKTQAAP